MKNKIHIVPITAKDLKWSFDSNNPSFTVKSGSYSHSIRVDPFPCYSHDLKLVKKEVKEIKQKFLLPVPVYIYIAEFEELSRTNAHASNGIDYNGRQDKEGNYIDWIGTIVCSGKRIPIMPSMTRYLISHEYGHLVDHYLEQKLNLKAGELRSVYAKLRNVTQPSYYGGPTWHKLIGEIFANDFRVLVMKKELEFWPHEVPRPEKNKKVKDWWKDRLREEGWIDV